MTASKKPSNKETVYVDVDDEITNIIDKVKESDSKIVALVLPKRATVMQSVVNMRLLKKAASSSKKSVVLITNEAGLLPLAGAAKIHVAKSLQSKPEIPPEPKIPGDDIEPEEANIDELDKSAAVGVLAAAAIGASDDDTETIELDNIDMENGADTTPVSSAGKAKKNRKLKVPNFERFRLSVVLAVAGVILLFVGWLFAFVIMPKATITITTDTTTLVSSFDFTASTAQTEVDAETGDIPATEMKLDKSNSKTVKATGEEDKGTKASGEVTLSLADCSEDSVTVPTGTAVSVGDLRFITQEQATMQSVEIGGNCANDSFPGASTDTIAVLSAENGDKYNLASGKSFSVAGRNNVDGENQDAFSGGTSKIVKVVSQEDIDKAVSEITTEFESSASEELGALLEAEQKLALDQTLFSEDPKIVSSKKVDDEAEEFNVKVDVSYSMLGVNRDDLRALIEKDIESEVDLNRQSISDDGIDNASMNINNQTSSTEAFISFRGSVTAGPEIDTEAIKNESAGKKRGEIEKDVSSLPGVNEVVVEYSPFWVYSTPKAAKKITVTVVQPDDAQQPANEGGNEQGQ